MQTKKGIDLNQSFSAVLALVLVAILVIIAILLFVNLNETFAGTLSETIINETSTPTDLGVALNGANNCSSASFVITEILNDSTATVINSGNWTIGADTGILTNLTSEFIDQSWNVSYTYTWGSQACEAGEDLITQFGTYPVLVGLVGTIIFLGLVIGVLVGSFAFGRKGL